MKTVPQNGGTVPLRNSKNPVVGVFRHHCGNIASVHNYQGPKKKHLFYLHCDKCGCDQGAGKPYQAEIKAGMYDTIEQLEAAESDVISNQVTPEVENTPETAADADYSEVVESETVDINTQVDSQDLTIKKPPHTAPDAVLTVETTAKDNKPRNVAIAAIFGAIFGGLFALAR
ncbi:hypothetical protein [Pseudoalteromonas aurantia]|uniref:Uncharacterized protein n=1 Tax=Pseudoalteromonas aurantia TaxID=43654 RepID=A0ABY2VYT4_9GAMM|nr:hypothetical protein [Pseudoalteromonas aurantia]TMO75323.1 hypothetical protein CWC20_08355 [Pseudoalteromonas aurantia]